MSSHCLLIFMASGEKSTANLKWLSERERERENVSSNSLLSGRHFSVRVERTFTRHGCQSLIKNNSQNRQLQVLEDKALITHSGSSKLYQEFGWAAIFHHCLLQGLRMGNSSHHLIKTEIDKNYQPLHPALSWMLQVLYLRQLYKGVASDSFWQFDGWVSRGIDS